MNGTPDESAATAAGVEPYLEPQHYAAPPAVRDTEKVEIAPIATFGPSCPAARRRS